MRYVACLGLLLIIGCAKENPTETELDNTQDPVSGESCESLPTPSLNLSSCRPKDTDYLPRESNSAGDTWESCISDNGVYSQLELSVSSIERVAGFDQIADILWRSGNVPTPEDFLSARDIYTVEQGLRTRVMRRYDPRLVAPDGGEWSCGDQATYLAYPEFCIGPSTIGPLVSQAFVDGIEGKTPLANAAQIEAGLTWFLYVSVLKEAKTCIETAKDCDSSWAYYSGGTQRDAPQGLAAMVQSVSPETHDRVFDAILALRCWRDLDSAVPAQNTELWQLASTQLEQALNHGMTTWMRQKALAVECATGDYAQAHQTYLKFSGPLLGPWLESYPDELSQAWESTDFDGSSVDNLLEQAFACP